MLTLFSNGFSPFARKVAMALAYKGLEFETVDGLKHANHERLLAVNPRAEVPVLVDGDITVVNSSDILAHLDLAYPERPIYPADLKARVEARALERLADTRVDAILLDCSIWTWAERKDPLLPGLIEAGQCDLDVIFARIENTLETFPTREFERTRIFWRGDRIEWLLARGFHDWFFGEIKAGRTLWPE